MSFVRRELDSDEVAWSEPIRPDRPLVLMLHGWSYDETQLFALRNRLAPGLTAASLRGPIPDAGGYAWFPSGDPIGHADPAVVNTAAELLLDWLDGQEPAGSVGLLGFSQGGAMAVQLMRHRPERFAWAVVLGGYVAGGGEPGDAALARRRPPVFWGRGADDVRIPVSTVDRTAAFLRLHCDLVERVYPGLGHEVAGHEIDDAAAFIRESTQEDARC